MRISFVAISLAVHLLAGCATETGKVIRLDPSTYYLEGSGAYPDLHQNFLLYRSAELTLASGHDLMLLEPAPRQGAPDVRRVTRDHSQSMPLGWLKSDARIAVSQEIANNWRPDGFDQRGTYSWIDSKIVVRMIKGPLPDDILAAIDARQIKSLLQANIDSRGKVAAGEPWQGTTEHGDACVDHDAVGGSDRGDPRNPARSE